MTYATDDSKLLNHQNLRLLHQNAQFATNKLDELSLMCDELKTDVLVVTEIGFNNMNIDLCKLPNYELATSFCRNSSKGGGVAIFVKQNLIFSESTIKQSSERDFEAVGVKLKTNNSKTTIVGIYRSPKGNEEVFFSKFENLLTDLTSHNQEFILMGDFNINALTPNDLSTKRLIDLLYTFGLDLLVSSPTRVTATSQTAIDNVISNIHNVAVSVVVTAVSDHYGQEAVISGTKFQREPKMDTKVRDVRPSNINLLNYRLAKEDWQFLDNNYLSVEQVFKNVNDLFLFHLDMCCPVKTVKVKTTEDKKSWITKGILISREKLKFFSEIYKTTSNENLKIFLKNYRKTYRKVIKAAKAHDVSRSIISSKNISKTSWDIINNSKNKPTIKQIKIKIGGDMVSDAFRVANDFNKFFSSVACEQGPRPAHPHTVPTSRQSPVASMALSPVTEEEIEQ
jgi:predicted outer membrane repeat protein